MSGFIPSSVSSRGEMLKFLGLKSVDELFFDIPGSVVIKNKLNLPAGRSEQSVRREMESIALQNKVYKTIFRGAGAYNHYIPAAVKAITRKEEFATAYTPYQPEISQGILQAFFEYQTLICKLTGMDVSNASVYDGANAAAAAAAMCSSKNKNRVLISGTVNPQVIETVKTYSYGSNTEVSVIPAKDGVTDSNALADMLSGDVACCIVEQPNYFGLIEDTQKLCGITHEGGARFIMSCNPISLSVLKTPAQVGADIAVGEGQPLGMPLSYGGPYLGFMVCKTELMRKLPGRIVGQTSDKEGKRAFVLTLQAREQHIRREKASSNICSNQAHCALTASVYLNAMGLNGLREVAEQCVSKAHYFAGKLCEIPGISLKYNGEFFHEFITDCSGKGEKILSALDAHGILGGLPIDSGILWCATEQNTREEIDLAVSVVKEASEE